MPCLIRKSRLVDYLMVSLALLLYWVMAVSVSPKMGVTGDEVVHITGGYSYWTLNDYRLHPENGNLAQRIAALPLLGMSLRFPPLDDPDWKASKVNLVGEKFFFQEGNPVARVLLASRMMIALVGAFTIWLTWRWAHGLFGRIAGGLAIWLAVFCPALLAHGGLATSDMVMTACTLGALTAYWRLLHRATLLRLVVASLACGLAFLSKMSGVIIVPIIAVLAVLRCIRPSPLVVVLARSHWIRSGWARWATAFALTVTTAIGSLIVLWAGYDFRFAGSNPAHKPSSGYYLSWDVVLDREELPLPVDTRLLQLRPASGPLEQTRIDHMVVWLRDRHILPEAYLWGFAQTSKFARQRPAFFMGEHRTDGWVGFFPMAFLLKTPPAAIVLGITGIAAGLWISWPRSKSRPARFRPWFYRAAPLMIFFGVYWTVALSMNLNIGHRHILPIYPVFYVLASAAVIWTVTSLRKMIALALIATAILHAGDSLMVRPYYLSYFQPLAGGMNRGYHYLVDSSLDWGQGLPDLERWLSEKSARGDRTPVYLSYFGADSPRARALDVIRFGDEISDRGPRNYPAQLRGGWYVISATNLVQAYAITRGPWTPLHTKLYLELQSRLKSAAAQHLRTEADSKQLLQDCMDMELMQAALVFNYLGNRPPHELVGGSLVVFKLEDAEINQALSGFRKL